MIPPRVLRFAFTLSRRQPCRQRHQTVAHPPPSQPQPVLARPSDYLHAIYEDLMLPDTSQPDVDSQVQAPNDALDGLLASYAARGNTKDFESVMSRTVSVIPTERWRDLHIKAHIVNASLPVHPLSSRVQRFPTDAIALLHKYEGNGHFAPVKSYTRVISALFNVQTHPTSDPNLGRAAAQAQAWDLFAHMRYVAHRVPDAHLYALMIRACGSFPRPEPERALDLWMEMQANDIKPTRGAYEAIIKTCGRAGPEWLGEGMRLAREMGDEYSITGANGRGLWCALLEGCKRAGDLAKARWILAEAVRDGGDSVVDAEVMTHVFHTYASYKAPFRRDATRLVDPNVASNPQETANVNESEETTTYSAPTSIELARDGDDANLPSFSRLPPQTSSDVIAETRTLFERILHDRYPLTKEARESAQGGVPMGGFARVELTPVLVNAYLSVFYSHAGIETSREVFDSLFNENSSSIAQVLCPDEHTVVNVLERCATARAEDRPIATRWAEDVWRRWEVIETNGLGSGKGTVGSFARLIERAHAAMRKVLVLSGDIDGGLTLLRTFVTRYPPNAVRHPADFCASSQVSTSTATELFTKPRILSTRTALANTVSPTSARPLVRFASVVTPKDDRVPPIITFSDVDLLHARLAEHGRVKDIGYIKWVCMAYTSALKRRRDAVFQAVLGDP